MTHDALARHLADHLRSSDRMTWCDMQLGPSGSVRPDVYTIYKSYVRPSPMAYEVKVTVTDFLGDVTSGKWQSYLNYACGVYFACERGLLTKDDVPEHCGLIVLHNAWRIAKKPVLRPVAIPQDAMIKLLIDGVEREGPRYRARGWSESDFVRQLKAKYGETVARTVSDRIAVDREIQDAAYRAERIISDAQHRANTLLEETKNSVAPLRMELCEILGLPSTAERWELEGAVRTLRKDAAEHPAQRSHRAMTEALQQMLTRYGWKSNEPDA